LENLEANQQVVDAKAGGEVAESFDTDFQQARKDLAPSGASCLGQHRLKIRRWLGPDQPVSW